MWYIRKTNEKFLEELVVKNKYYKNREFTVDNEYTTRTCKLQVTTRYRVTNKW